MIKAILTDIEGTTSSVSFVFEVLFPYARAHLADFVRAHAEDPAVRAALKALAAEEGRPLTDEEAIAVLLGYIDADKKATSLKALQGMIWKAGYLDGSFTGHVYDDAAERLRAWHREGLLLYVYSSGSVEAQKLIFGYSDHGDLTGLFSGYFDTTTGPKREADSYRKIVDTIGVAASEILFLSDVEAELDAAAAAGMRTTWLVRDGVLDSGARHPQVQSFADIEVE